MATSNEQVVQALRASLKEAERLRKENAELAAAAHEPIAVVAIGCRFPGGVRSADDLWEVVAGGRDVITAFPDDRGWDLPYDPDPERPGATYTRHGGFVHDVADFDPGFFEISPREALAMDPQQRLLLETSWEALERAGVDPGSLRGSRTGVFVGSAGGFYADLLRRDPAIGEGYLAIGTAGAVVSGRLSYTFGFEGPALTVDTACSSSLVAMHYAARSLRSGECSLALAGGVTVMATPDIFTEFSRQRGLAPDGRVKAFSSSADGTGFAEGAGVLVLEKLSDARRNGHPVLAVIRGSAINQDGASNGLTAPNGPSQRRVIRQALSDAGLTAADVDVVEAHGTGTTLGDPIEAQALLATYGQDRPEGRPLWLGSVKSNIGHTQAASGVAGVIKMVMAMRHGVLPRTLNVTEPSSHVDWSAGDVELLTEAREWGAEGLRRAGVSSFGVSGTNAHLILEQVPADEAPQARKAGAGTAPVSGAVPWVLSGRSPEAVRGQAAKLLELVTADATAADAADVGWSLATSRSVFEHRAVVVGADTEELTGKLRALADGAEAAGVVRGAVSGSGKPVFVFPGQGSQWVGMAAGLWETSPAFRESMTACGEALKPFVDWDLETVLGDEEMLQRVDVVQPVLWAVMVSLAAVWRSCGVEPAAVVGHSQGEIAAAVVAGGLSLEDGARVVALRSRAIIKLAGRGGMVSVPLSFTEVEERVARFEGVSVAAVNGPNSVVVSGDTAGLDALLAACEEEGVRARRIAVDYASHSAHVEVIRDEVLTALGPVAPRTGSVPYYSALTGGLLDTAGLDAEYWYENLRRTVRFEDAVRALLADGHGVFVESSAHPVLVVGVQETIDDAGADAVTVGTLRRNDGGPERLLASLAEAWTRGVKADWQALFAGTGAGRVDLPTYAFQAQRLWPEVPAAADTSDGEFWAAVESGELAIDDGAKQTVLGWRQGRTLRAALDSWRYRVDWKPLPEPARAEPAGTWLLIGDGTTEAAEWAERLTGAGVQVVHGTAEALPEGPFDGVVSLLGTAVGTLTLVQALVRHGVTAPLWLVTRGAVDADGAVTDPGQAQVWGLGRVVGLEYPDLWGGLLDLPAEPGDTEWTRILAALAGIGHEDQLAVRTSGLYARRLARAPLAGREADRPWQPRGTVLITGGTGALGAHVARRLAAEGAEHLVLTSRRGADAEGAAELSAELTELGARVTIAACDIADRDAVAALLDGLDVNAVFHAAGVAPSVPLADTTPESFAATLAAKADGARHLHDLLDGTDLDAFVLFSSNAGVWGSGGQSAYAAANAYLDALASWRRAQGLRATSVAWGAWAGGGIASTGDAEENLRRRGVRAMDPEPAVAALRQALDHDETFVAVADVDWETFVPTFTIARHRPLIADLPDVRELLRTGGSADEPRSELARRITGLDTAGQLALITETVRAQAAAVLGHESADAVEPARAFKELGFDSLTAVELRNRLNAATGLRLPATLVFDYPTAQTLAAFVRTELVGEPDQDPAGAANTADTASAGIADEPLAIVGMSCRFPGGVESPEDLWQLVRDGVDAISPFPVDRGWDLERLYHPDPDQPGTSYTREGGFLHDAGEFDPGFFGISPREALAIDPQQRLLLQASWEAFERAGIDPAALRGSRTGVFVGASASDYGSDVRRAPEGTEGHLLMGSAASAVSGRVSYTFGLEGPAVSVDTACSSSLVALHLACQSLRQGESSMALVGGVLVMSSPAGIVEFSRLRALSPDGRCRAFGAGADGTGFAEGVGVLLVERLSDARRNGHQVLAVVRGSAVNQDGASNGLTAPNGPAQRRVIRQALTAAGLSAADVDVVEAHGTGTTLGDPIEAQALLATYGKDRPEDRPLRLGSLKSNIGHTQAAAGVAGVIKMVMALRHRVMPRTLHAEEASPHVDWSAGTVELLTEAREWTAAGPRRAGVSSFGGSGTNAHLILEEAPEVPETAEPADAPDPAAAGPVPLLLSARGGAALRDQARKLTATVGSETPLLDIAHSLAAFRTAHDHRAVVVGADRDTLLAGLAALAAGTEAPGVALGTAGPGTKPVFVFPGQGSQWVGMAAGLLASEPVFRDSVAECARALEPFLDWDVTAALDDPELLKRVDVVQPVLWTMMVSLAAVWRSYGVEPAAVVGHSQGEIAAAVVAGGLSLEDGARIVALRSQAWLSLAGKGGMASVALPAADVRERLERFGDALSVAAVNGPAACAVAGDPAALDELVAGLVAEGHRARRIEGIDTAGHSAQVDALRERLLADLAPVAPRTSDIPFYSTVTGGRFDTAGLDTGYWYRNMREPVEFEAAVRALSDDGHRLFVETSPHPVLGTAILGTALDAVTVGTLRRDEDGPARLLTALGEAWTHGVSVDWPGLFAGTGARRVDLPTYAFQKQHYWLESQPALDTEFWAAVESGELGLDDDALQAVTAWRESRQNTSTADSWRYGIVWKPVSVPPPVALGTWLVVTAPGTVSPLPGAPTLELTDADTDRAVLAERLREAADGRPLSGVLSLAGADERTLPGHSTVAYGTAHTVALVQALGDAGIDSPLWVATRGAVAVGDERISSPVQAQLWGLGRVAAQEYPQRWGGLVDLPETLDDDAVARLTAVVCGGPAGEDQVAVRADGVHARRLGRVPGTATRDWNPSGTVLVTGGTGAVGARIGRWLAANGATHVVLVSRSGPAAPGAAELADDIRELGARATVAACDITDRDALAELIDDLDDLTAVVHAAVVLDDGVFDVLDPARFDRVLAPKVTAARHLHDLTAGLDLSAFVFFSSAAGTLGNGGQANYAAANAYLDALAEQRRADGLTATSVAWGPWGGGGSADGAIGERLSRQGAPAMDPDTAISALHRALRRDDTFVAVVDIRWETFAPAFTAARRSPLLSDLPEVRSLPERSSLAEQLAGLTGTERDKLLLDLVRGQAAAVLGYPSVDAVEPDRAFRELGFDSLTAVEVRNRLSAAVGLKLPATVVFDYPTPLALARHLRDRVGGETAPAAPAALAPAPAAAPAADDPIAIVAMGCRFPGGIETPEQLWDLLASGGDAVAGFPEDRGWDLEALYDADPDQEGTTYAREGGFLHDATEFDPAFFGISPREALAIDPQQRLLLEVSWEAVERAGIDPTTLRGTRSGVFVGNTGQAYSALLERNPEGTEGYLLTGNTSSVLSGRVAYTLGLEGPAMTVDTACSSSLLALHLAAQSLRRGECDLALAGGVTVMSSPGGFVEFSRQRGLAADGRCKAFDAAADGTGFAEGVGMVVVERLSDAHRNGHPVLAILRGSAVNQDGASNGLTAPNGPAQQRVIRQALADAGLTAADVDAVEAHGTGTRLGDPIEAQALLATYGQHRPADRPLLLGTLKSNIGHTLAAAGIAGVMKVVLSLQNDLLPRSLHISEPTPHVDWSEGDVRLLTEAVPWTGGDRPRRAGVSSFGISGTNAHAVIEQAPPAPELPARGPAAPLLPVVLSARDETALREQARRLRTATGGHEPVDLAYSLATTRAALEYRAVVVAEDADSLAAGLDAVADGTEAASVVRGTARGTGLLAVLFSGQGSQRLGMGRELYDTYPVYADAFDDVCARFELPVKDVVFGDDAAVLERTEYTQAALFAVEVALYRLVESWGVRPDYLAGHSVGEIAAAHIAGVLSLDDACTLVAARGRLMQALPEGGAMVAVEASEEDVRPHLAETDGVDIAAVNGPKAVVLSGDEDAVLALASRWKNKRLRVSHAFHSHRMDPMLAEFRTVAESLSYERAVIPVAGQPAQVDAEYWVRHVRDAVRFHDAVRVLADAGVTTHLELGPDGILSALVGGIAVLRRKRPEHTTLVTALAALHTAGAGIDWAAFYAGTGARRVDLPTYAFQRQRYWPAAAPAAAPVTGDVIEARFWEAVEREDLTALAATLDTSGDQLSAVLPALSTWRRRRRTETEVDSWRYRVEWKPATGAVSPALTGTWLLVGAGSTTTAGEVERALVRCGATVVRAEGPGELTRDLLDGVTGVLSLLALDGTPHPERPDVPRGLAATTELLRALGTAGTEAPLWVATRGAVAVNRAEAARPGHGIDPAQAAVWGLGQVIGLEQPRRWGGLLDLPENIDGRAATRIGGVLSGRSGEDQAAVRASGVFRRRLVRAPRGDTAPATSWRPSGTVLVTGGTGALGGHVARWLAGAGAEHLVLTSRRGLDAPGAVELRDELVSSGVRVSVPACDVSDRDALAALLAEHPVDAVFHTAGVLDDGVLDGLTPERFETVFRAKVRSALNLHELAGDLSAFVLFSSLAGIMGNAGQGNYAAANAYLDALAEQRRAAGLPATSVAWGAWEGGMADGSAAAERVRRGGIPPMAPGLAVAALQQALDHQDTVLAVADIDWDRTLPEFSASRPNPLVAHLATPEPTTATAPVAAPAVERPTGEQDLLQLVRGHVAAVLGHGSPDLVDPERAFRDLGFDSLTAVELRNRLGAATGRTLPATLVFDHPSPTALARFLGEGDGHGHGDGNGDNGPRTAPGTPAQRTTSTAAADEPIAIIGMACRFPGDVRSPEDLWQLLVDGRDAVTAFPANRGWGDVTDSHTHEGAFLHDADRFDPEFFGISPREALAMDPQQRLLLETSWEAFERAGIDPAALRGSRTGVFVGTNGQDYVNLLLRATDDVEGFLGTGNAAAVVSGRLSYTFGLEGPAVTVDTACSSSLVALHWAAQALRSGECSLALAGGVTVMSGPAAFTEFSKQGGLAADGRVKAFAAAADGTAWGEGAGLLLVERLSDARRNGHRVLAVISGSAVNQDGASNGLTAPNGPSQQRVIHQALDAAGLTPADVGAVEAHGTGTTLGDPIEAQALLATYGKDRPGDRPLFLGGIKSNIGHTQAAAGVAGVIKMVMAIRNGILPRTLHVDEPSPHVDWTAGAVELLTEAREWDSEGPRRAGVSSFGMSGTNAHLIVEQAPDPTTSLEAPDGPDSTTTLEDDGPAGAVLPLIPVPVSARSRTALRDQAARFAAAGHGPLDLAYSAATTRGALEHRAVVLASDEDTLARGLATVLDGGAVVGQAASTGRTAFLFSGQGSQRLGMGRELYETFPVYAEAFDAACARLDTGLERPLAEVVFGDDAELLNRTEFTQAALFAVEVALYRLVESWGVRPDFLAGHSVGEIAAAHVAGMLSLDDACTLVAARGRLMGALPEGGAMVAVEASEEDVRPLLTDGVDIAAVNGPRSVVLSGDEDAVLALAARWKNKRLKVSHAFHSHRMDPMLDEFRTVAESLSYERASVPVAGRPAQVDAEYWVNHVRDAVRFHGALESLRAEGVTTFLEIGPDGILSALAEGGVPLLRRDRAEVESALTALARLYVAGTVVDWEALFAGTGARRVDLPTYAFQRRSYWPELAPASEDAEFWAAVENGELAEVLEPVLPALTAWRERRSEKSAVDAWRYRADWVRLPETAAPELTGRWLLLAPPNDSTGFAEALADGIRAAGAEVTTDPADTDGVTGVLSLLALDGTPLETGTSPALHATLEAVRAAVDAPLWVVTRGGVSLEGTPDPAQAAVWGLGRVAGLEQPARWGGLVDLPAGTETGTETGTGSGTDSATAGRIVSGLVTALALAGTSGEDQLAVRASGLYARRFVRARAAGDGTGWRPSGTVLVTGGTGALGGHVARWLAGAGAEHLVLTSRRGLDAPGAVELRDELVSSGVRVSVPACDVSDRDALAALLAEYPVDAVFHTAGVLDDGVLDGLTPERFETVFRAKVRSALNLHELAGDLSAFVLFSSTAGFFGSSGQGNYAAANAYLDALAESRRAAGLPATSVAWGPWAQGGMADAVGARLRRTGVRPMRPDLAVTALGRALEHDDAVLAVADIDWPRFAPEFAAVRPNRLFDAVPEAAAAVAAPPQDMAGRIAAMTPAERDRALLDLVRRQIAAVLGHDGPTSVAPDRAFGDLGFDSLTAVELRNALGTATGLRLPPTLAFDHPTPAALAAFLGTELTGAPDDTAAVVTTTTAAVDEPIAVIAMSCRFPGGVASPEELWELLASGGDAVGPLPTDRGWDVTFDADGGREGTIAARAGSFLDGVADFDPAFFGISPREALALDPQQRLLLETSWEAFERAGIDPAALRGTPAGVFIGSNGQDYGAVLMNAKESTEGYAGTGTAASVISGRLAYTFGLEGPTVTVDTACSSSLVALHLAAQALRQGECSLALVGGVTVMTTPAAFVEFSRQRGLAEDGRCKAFADAADGTGWGEGVGILLVERLSDARRNGHQVLAVVRGSAVNQDGASNGLTAPNGPSQQRVIRQALASAGLSAADVDAVEAHGTGTTLGDPIEAQALLATYGRDRSGEQPLWLGSVKSNIGHTQAAAGVAGVIKMVMAMREGVLPRTLHIDEPSSHVDWESGAVRLLTEARDWAADRTRRAGVSSFGMSGTNAHVILEEAAEEPVAATAGRVLPPLVPVPLSAASAPALAAQAAALRQTAAAGGLGDLGDLAYSLATTRSALDHRAVVIGGDRDAVADGLTAIAEGRPGPVTGVVTGVVEDGHLAFLFSGQGSQRLGMGRELYDTYPVYAEAFDTVCARFELPVKETVFGEDADRLNRTEFTQAALFAVEVALYRLVESWGVRPDFLAGHSVGEIAAAHAAGVLSLDDACTLVAARGRLMGALPEGGAMAAVEASEEDVRPHLTDGIDIAAVNGPRSVVLSGDEDAVLALASRWKNKRLKVSHAFHSHLMDPMLDEFRTVAEVLSYERASVPVAGLPARVDAEYWVNHVRDAVRFHDALERLRTGGVTTFLEIGPDGILSALADGGVPLLRRDRSEAESALTALARLHTTGTPVDWAALVPGSRRIPLPTYPFQRQRYWPEQTARTAGDSRFWTAVDTGELGLDEAALAAVTAWRDRQRQEAAHEAWRYRTDWKPLTAAPAALHGTWLVLIPGSAHRPTADTDRAWLARAADALPDALTVTADRIGALSGGEFAGVLSLLALGAYDDPRGATLATAAAVRALGDAGIGAPLWIATAGAVSTGRSDRVRAADRTAVWGLGRVVGLEHPDRWGGLVDLPERADDRAVARLAAALGTTDEDQLAVRPSGILLRRLAHRPFTRVHRTWTPRGTVLITGGTGGLGLRTAEWLAGAGAEHLVLASRRGGDAEALAARLGTRVTVAACDMTDRDAVAALLDSLPGLTAVVHAAGVAATRPLADSDPDDLAAVMAAKVLGAAHLDELLGEREREQGRELDAFVLFSSIAGVWGSGGQSAYAAANAYLDGLAEDRRARGLAATAVAWGPWAEIGMAADPEAGELLRRRGLPALAPAAAVAALRRALDEDLTQVTVADVDWARFAPAFAAARTRPLIADLPEVVRLGAAADGGTPELVHTLRPLPAAERTRTLVELVRGEAAAVLGHTGTDGVTAGRPFRDLGFDSLTAVELRNRLGAATGLTLPTTLVFDYPTAEALAGLLGTELLGTELLGTEGTEGAEGSTGPRTAALPAVAVAGADEDDPVVIIGMSCRFPGGVRSPRDLWNLALDGTDAITGFPADRGWDLGGLYDADPESTGTSTTAEGGFVHDAATFDAAFFGISPREALAMDPQQRLLLEASWEALENAGIDPARLRGTQAGVFVGVSPSGYGAGITEAPEGTEGYFLTGSATAVASGRLSYTFGLEGPAVTVDTACSSSLVALHYAAQSLR
ncbi:type I polyketide synthase, partial [Streptomyces sp. NPDC003691]